MSDQVDPRAQSLARAVGSLWQPGQRIDAAMARTLLGVITRQVPVDRAADDPEWMTVARRLQPALGEVMSGSDESARERIERDLETLLSFSDDAPPPASIR